MCQHFSAEQRHQECSCEESLTQWAGVVSFLRTVTPVNSVMVLSLMVLSKPSSKGSAMGCAMSPAVHLSPQLAQALPSPELCLIRDHASMSAATKGSV